MKLTKTLYSKTYLVNVFLGVVSYSISHRGSLTNPPALMLADFILMYDELIKDFPELSPEWVKVKSDGALIFAAPMSVPIPPNWTERCRDDGWHWDAFAIRPADMAQKRGVES